MTNIIDLRAKRGNFTTAEANLWFEAEIEEFREAAAAVPISNAVAVPSDDEGVKRYIHASLELLDVIGCVRIGSDHDIVAALAMIRGTPAVFRFLTSDATGPAVGSPETLSWARILCRRWRQSQLDRGRAAVSAEAIELDLLRVIFRTTVFAMRGVR